jgi:hypothetical protein
MDAITLEDVQYVARQMFRHIDEWDTSKAFSSLQSPSPRRAHSDRSLDDDGIIEPAAVVASIPTLDRNGQPFELANEEVIELSIIVLIICVLMHVKMCGHQLCSVISTALEKEVEPLVDTPVLTTLLSAETMHAKWAPIERKGGGIQDYRYNNQTNTTHYALAHNGIRVNINANNNHPVPSVSNVRSVEMPASSKSFEPRRVTVRLTLPGGRALETVDKPGLMSLGCATIQEGGMPESNVCGLL